MPAHDPQGLRSYATYWLAMGQWANAVENYPAAEWAYAQALRLNPEDGIAKNNLLWMLVDSGNVHALRALLVGDALQPPESLRNVTQNALERLGHNTAALFLARQNLPSPQPNSLRLLNEASLWESAGSPGIAWSLRQNVIADSLSSLHKNYWQGVTPHE